MDVILHLGAHRTGTTSFQDYMRRHAEPLSAQGIGFWGPRRTRGGLYPGILEDDLCSVQDADGLEGGAARLRSHLDRVCRRGIDKLVVSDENMIGTMRGNIGQRALYPAIGERMARFARAFDGRISAVMISPRSLEVYWCSVLAYGVSRGQAVPRREDLHQIAMAPRGWRDVITDLAGVLRGVPIRVLPFEQFVGRPEVMLSRGGDIEAPFDSARSWLNRAPALPDLRRALNERGASPAALPFGMGRWNPFTNEEHAALREMHADDMMWLQAGADGLATLTEDRPGDRAGLTPPRGTQGKGQAHEFEKRKMARPG